MFVVFPLVQRKREATLAAQLEKTHDPLEAVLLVDAAVTESKREGSAFGAARGVWAFPLPLVVAGRSRGSRRRMYFLLVAGVFAVVAPTWIICACGMGELEDEAWLRWLVRAVGLIGAGVAVYSMFGRH